MSRQMPLDESEKQSSKDLFPTANDSAEPIQTLGEEIDEKALKRVIRKVRSSSSPTGEQRRNQMDADGQIDKRLIPPLAILCV
jgi:hypothetical protein